MRVFYSDQHHAHDPPGQFNVERMGAYSECPARATSILDALRKSSAHQIDPPADYEISILRTVHDDEYIRFLQEAWSVWSGTGRSIPLIPYTFAHRYALHQSADIIARAGYFGFDPQTPIVAGTFDAAWASARCALTAADLVRKGEPVAYALCRPPGHHAAADLYGGYCYLNNAALAAKKTGAKSAILDIDYHHGNGTQTIFYDDPDVFTSSIHAHPDREYPFYSGCETETGAGNQTNFNIPLPPDVDDDDYIAALGSALDRIDRFNPATLIVSAGFDTYCADPLGDFNVGLEGFGRIGRCIRELGRPTVIVQEGGYHLEHLGECVDHFLGAWA